MSASPNDAPVVSRLPTVSPFRNIGGAIKLLPAEPVSKIRPSNFWENLNSVKEVCGRVLHLESGMIRDEGDQEVVIANYLRHINDREVICI